LFAFAKANKRPYPAYYNVLREISQEFAYGNQHEQYNMYIAFTKRYQTMAAFYSKEQLKQFVPCHGVMIPAGAFAEEKVDA
jgi:hypothetical protein